MDSDFVKMLVAIAATVIGGLLVQALWQDHRDNQPLSITVVPNHEKLADDIIVRNPSTRTRRVTQATFWVERRYRYRGPPLTGAMHTPDRIIFDASDYQRQGDVYVKQISNIEITANGKYDTIRAYVVDRKHAGKTLEGKLVISLENGEPITRSIRIVVFARRDDVPSP